MFKRIRYTKTANPNILESVKSYQHATNGGRFTIRLNTEALEFILTDEVADKVVRRGIAKNLHQLKKDAKHALNEFGVSFSNEQRKHRSSVQQVA